jgi:acyl carrier protein
LGLDSLDLVTLAFELEDAFHVSIPDEKIRSVRSVSDIIEGIRALQPAQPDASAAGG